MIHYNVAVESGPYSLEIRVPWGNQTEADVDSGIEAFADAYNAIHAVTSVTKTYDGAATTDWSYTP